MTPPVPVSAVEALMAAITALATLLEQENAALARSDSDALRRLAEDKPRACRAYEEAATALSASAALLGPARRAEVRRALTGLAGIAAVNRRRLAAALAAHHRLMELVAEALRAREPGTGAYAAGGSLPRARRALPPPAFGFDRAL